MPIVLVRIDDRLIHGQIVEGWLKPMRANYIAVASDHVAKDRSQQILLSMAVPSTIKVSSFSVDEAAKKISEGYFEKERVLLLLSGPKDVLRLLTGGVKLSSVNVGGMHYTSGKKQILRTLSVDKNDVLALKEISQRGVELEGRVLPMDDKIDIMEALHKELGKDLDKI